MATRARQMPMEFEVFRASCAEHGYTQRVSDCGTYYVMFTKNGVKTEIKPRWYTVGYGRSQSDLDVLERALQEHGFAIVSRKNSVINVLYEQDVDVLERFWAIVAMEEAIDEIVAASRGVGTRVFTREQADTAIWSKIARAYRFAIDNQHQYMLDDHRNILCADAVDHLIIIGSSCGRTAEDSYREHVVPCVMIHNRAIELTRAGEPACVVAAMIAANMMIVQITSAEAELLDETLGLRTSMPEGWAWGDSPLARLHFAGIKLA